MDQKLAAAGHATKPSGGKARAGSRGATRTKRGWDSEGEEEGPGPRYTPAGSASRPQKRRGKKKKTNAGSKDEEGEEGEESGGAEAEEESPAQRASSGGGRARPALDSFVEVLIEAGDAPSGCETTEGEAWVPFQVSWLPHRTPIFNALNLADFAWIDELHMREEGAGWRRVDPKKRSERGQEALSDRGVAFFGRLATGVPPGKPDERRLEGLGVGPETGQVLDLERVAAKLFEAEPALLRLARGLIQALG